MGLIRIRSAPLTAAVAALTTVMLSLGLAAAAVVEEAPSTGQERTATGKLGLTQLSGPRPEEPEPAVTPAGPATAAGTAPREASYGSPEAPPLPGHRTPGAVVSPFRAGRTEWSGVSNGISIRLVLSTPSPRAGEPVTFVAEASMPGAPCCNLMLQFGDGSGGDYPPSPGLGGHFDCAAREPKSSSVRGEIRHVYNKAGRWNFSLSARSGGGCSSSSPPATYGSVDGTLEIGGGSSAPTPQGPAAPSVRPASIHPYAPRVITLSAEARDDDGHIDRLLVDWGDGSATETYKNPQPCRTMASGWPAGSYTILPLWMGVGPVTHRYGDDTPHKITVTAVSTSCSGTGEQRVSGTLTFPEPPPPPPPLESVPWPTLTNSGPPPPISSLPGSPPAFFPTPQLTTTTSVPARP